MSRSVDSAVSELKGMVDSSSFQTRAVTKADVVRCLQAAIESFMASRNLTQEALAETICGVSQGYFSKVTNGQQGDLFGFVYEKLPADIRQDFIERLAELERLDPFVLALEQLMVAAVRVIRTGRSFRSGRAAMAKAQIPERTRKTA